MNTHRLVAACAAALVTCVTLGCKDIPLLPKWDATWNVPLPSQSIKQLFGPTTVTVPAGTSSSVSFPAQALPLDGPIGEVLKNRDTTTSLDVAIALTKSVALSGSDTLFVAATTADLTNTAAQRIVVPITMVAANAKDSTLATFSPGSGALTMLNTQVNSGGTLQVQLRGRVTCPGPASCTVTPSDSIGVQLRLNATIWIAR